MKVTTALLVIGAGAAVVYLWRRHEPDPLPAGMVQTWLAQAAWWQADPLGWFWRGAPDPEDDL
jgi:hypothetical protein